LKVTLNSTPISTASLFLANPAATDAFGHALADVLRPGMVIYLVGALGAGKTAIARALLRKMGVDGTIKSPTYTLVELYVVSRLSLYHFDFYRLQDPEEWLEAGLRDYFNPDSICLVEWPDKAGNSLPQADIVLSLVLENEGRQLQMLSNTKMGQECINSALTGLKQKMQMPPIT
jgi:tRNA threonylcarbamoyladenosine biosynthesis protein TsaE